MVNRLWRAGVIRGIDSQKDALQEAYIALVEAIETQNPQHEKVSWSVYICRCIRRHLIKKSLEGGVIRTSYASNKASKETQKKACAARKTSNAYSSVDVAVQTNPSYRMELQEVMAAFRHLTDEEQELLRGRFGFGGKPISFRAFGERIRVSHEEVRLRYKEALRKLRQRLDL